MLREAISDNFDNDPNFAWRGVTVTRIENLSDIVFALALAMLVSASSTVVTFGDLTDHLITIIPVAAGFALFLLIWNQHFVFFRRYGLADATIVFLNACLLLLVLFLAYPLRFIFTSFLAYIFALFGDLELIVEMEVGYREAGVLLAYFAAGYGFVFLIISLMYAHALKQGDVLELTATERTFTKRSIWGHRAQVLCASLVFIGGAFTPASGFAGFFMFLTWPLTWLVERCFPISTRTAKTDEKLG